MNSKREQMEMGIKIRELTLAPPYSFEWIPADKWETLLEDYIYNPESPGAVVFVAQRRFDIVPFIKSELYYRMKIYQTSDGKASIELDYPNISADAAVYYANMVSRYSVIEEWNSWMYNNTKATAIVDLCEDESDISDFESLGGIYSTGRYFIPFRNLEKTKKDLFPNKAAEIRIKQHFNIPVDINTIDNVTMIDLL